MHPQIAASQTLLQMMWAATFLAQAFLRANPGVGAMVDFVADVIAHLPTMADGTADKVVQTVLHESMLKMRTAMHDRRKALSQPRNVERKGNGWDWSCLAPPKTSMSPIARALSFDLVDGLALIHAAAQAHLHTAGWSDLTSVSHFVVKVLKWMPVLDELDGSEGAFRDAWSRIYLSLEPEFGVQECRQRHASDKRIAQLAIAEKTWSQKMIASTTMMTETQALRTITNEVAHADKVQRENQMIVEEMMMPAGSKENGSKHQSSSRAMRPIRPMPRRSEKPAVF